MDNAADMVKIARTLPDKRKNVEVRLGDVFGLSAYGQAEAGEEGEEQLLQADAICAPHVLNYLE